MVRTYTDDDFHLLSPWEKAMRIADAEANNPIQTGKRMYGNLNSSLSMYSEPAHLKLPPITEDPQQTIEFLGVEVGKVLVRAKRKLKIIRNEVVLYDPLETGLMSKAAAYEILKRYKLPPNDNYQRKIVALFISKTEPGKVDRFKMMEFLENSFIESRNIAGMKKKQEELNGSTSHRSEYNDSVHGRYDSETTTHEREYEPRKAEVLHRAFASRRDAGLSLEIERAFSNSGTDPHEVIARLESAIKSTCLNERHADLKLVNNMHLKGLVAKNKFPINPSLTIKCIERLDPYNNGEIEWPRFIDFLQKAVCGIPSSSEQSSRISSQSSISSISTLGSIRAPLPDIKRNNDIALMDEQFAFTPNTNMMSLQVPHHNNMMNSQHTLPPHNNYLHVEHFPNSPRDTTDDINSPFVSTSWDPGVQSTAQIENDRSSEIDIPVFNDSFEDKVHAVSGKGEVYRRAADALTDKAMFNNGMISTSDVRKTLNYYNMLFDADINLEKMNAALDKYSKNDYVDVKIVIDSFQKAVM